jgi:hypothetical protein
MQDSRSPSSVRPSLETLERRDVPSFVGFALLNLNNQISASTNTMQAEVSQLQTAQQKLTSDIQGTNNLAGPLLAARFAISADYARCGSLFGQIKGLNTEISDLTNLRQTLAFAAFSGDQFDQTIAMQVLFGGGGGLFGGLFGGGGAAATSSPATLFGQANTIVNTAEPFGFPTIASGANV